MDSYGRKFTHFQIDGGTLDVRFFDCAPEIGGIAAFHPTRPMFYLTAIDVGGYETFLDRRPDKASLIETAKALWHVYDVPRLVDLTVSPSTGVSYLRPSEAGWSHICVSGGTAEPKRFNLSPSLGDVCEEARTSRPDDACFYACAIDESGYEWPLYTGYSVEEARLQAVSARETYGVLEVLDLTMIGSA